MNKLHSFNMSGNLHEATAYLNRHLPEFVDGVVHMDCVGYNSLVVFRASEEAIEKAKREGRL